MSANSDLMMSVDRLVHEPARLVILTSLSSAESVEFRFIESLTGLTAGNLSSHLNKLESGGYVTIEKSFREKRPLTRVKITKTGRKALKDYREQMRKLLE